MTIDVVRISDQNNCKIVRELIFLRKADRSIVFRDAPQSPEIYQAGTLSFAAQFY